MARELLLVQWCDGEHGDENVPAVVARTLALDTMGPILLDLCATCDKSVQDIALLMERGVPAEQAVVVPGTTVTPRQPRTVERIAPRVASRMKDSVAWRTCPICGHTAPTRSANGQHLKQKHEKTLGDFDWPVE